MNVLIVGRTSYIGAAVRRYLLDHEAARVSQISVRDDAWRSMDLSEYDAVVFAAAIVHRKDITDPEVYRRVNTDLPFEFAKKAKAEGVGQFLFLSTAAVYGVEKTLPGTAWITAQTPLSPVKPYGKSKLEAEMLLHTLEDERFRVSIVRTINVYGRDCPGNYISQFMRIARLLPLHPKAFLEAKQGFIHVDSLAKLCALCLKSGKSGVYHAQDPEAVCAWEILQDLACAMGLKRGSIPCHTAARLLPRISPVVKFFGGVAYDPELTRCPLGDYHTVECREGMRRLLEE